VNISQSSLGGPPGDKAARFQQNKPRVVSKRYIRSSPPREVGPPPANRTTTPTLAQQQPEQTRTGLILTKPFRDRESPQFGNGLRCVSSTDLVLPLNSSVCSSKKSGGVAMDRSKSVSSGALFTTGRKQTVVSVRRPDFSHVESKVKNYIHSVKSLADGGQSAEKSMQKSKSCGNLSPSKVSRERRNSLTEIRQPAEKPRPKTAPSGATLTLQQRSSQPGAQPLPGDTVLEGHNVQDEIDFALYHQDIEERTAVRRSMSQAHSKSDPNLSSMQPRPPPCATSRGGLSKSAVSVGNLAYLIDSEDSDYEVKARYFSRDNVNEFFIESEDLLHLGK
jgi:hypothetical protein